MNNTKTSLTISTDNNNKVNVSSKNNNMNKKRKESWDSKVSVSTVSTRVLTRADTPSASSILSSDSDIRFTRKLGRQYRCGCCILASFIAFLLIIALGLYVGYTLVGVERNADLVFHGSFRVTNGDSFASALADPSTREFFLRARDYRERLNLIFRRSRLRPGFISTDVLAFDGVEKEDLVVHFAARFDPRHSGAVVATDLIRVIQAVVLNNSNAGVALSGLSVDPSSFDVHIEDGNSTVHRKPLKVTTTTPQPSPAPPRRCTPLQLDYCRQLPYNVTTYPNVVGHSNLDELNRDVIAFRELVDAECYRLAYDFVCRALQPACGVGNSTEDSIVLPCRDFCEEFSEGCGARVAPRFRDRLRCSEMPVWSGKGSCLRRPETSCVEELHRRDMATRICDGVPDCGDMADEAKCAYCGEGRVQCGTGPVCIAQQELCDGTPNCPGGLDEKNCLSVTPRLSEPSPLYIQNSKFSEGFVVLTEKGVQGKLCTENLNRTVPAPNREATLYTVASWICSLLSFQKAEKIHVQVDEEKTNSYVHMEDPTASDITFVHAPCPTKEVLYVSCSQLECGLRPLADSSASMSEKAGAWPWHVALTKNDINVCDGVLIDRSWLLTSSACFQGQDDANWIAKLGTARLSSSPPWLQTRRFLSRVEDPQNKSLTLVQLDQPVSYTDFVRPICLPEAADEGISSEQCTTISWTRGDVLESTKISIVSNDRCGNMTFDSTNEFCTSSASINKDCSEETPAGNPLMCLSKDKKRWRLIGIHHWSSWCRKSPGEVISAYQTVVPVFDWIQRTIANVTDANNPRKGPGLS